MLKRIAAEVYQLTSLIRSIRQRVPYLAPATVLVVLLLAFTPVFLASRTERGFARCQSDHDKCKDQVIQMVLQTPDDRETVARAAFAIYGPVISALQQSESSVYTNLSPNLENSYYQLNAALLSGQLDPACVRDGLAELLIKEKLDNARAQILAESFDAVGTTAGLGPPTTRAYKYYFKTVSSLPEIGVFLAGTYKNYVNFPYLEGSELMCPST